MTKKEAATLGGLALHAKYDFNGENNPNWKGGISQNYYHYKKIQKQRYPEKIKARVSGISGFIARIVDMGLGAPEKQSSRHILLKGEQNEDIFKGDFSAWLAYPNRLSFFRRLFEGRFVRDMPKLTIKFTGDNAEEAREIFFD